MSDIVYIQHENTFLHPECPKAKPPVIKIDKW